MKKYQSGFAHLVIITVILAVGLFGALGYVVWDKVINKEQDVSDIQEDTDTSDGDEDQGVTDEEVDPYEGWKTVTETASGENLSLKYPSDWSVSKETYAGPYDMINITNPRSSVKISFAANLDGIGGVCPTDNPAYVIYSVTREDVTNYSGYKFYSAITQRSNGSNSTYQYVGTVLQDGDSSANIKVGASACYFTMRVFRIKTNSDVIASINLRLMDVEQANYDNPEAINKVMDTEDFKDAVKIVQSLFAK